MVKIRQGFNFEVLLNPTSGPNYFNRYILKGVAA